MNWGTAFEVRKTLIKRWDSGALIRQLKTEGLDFPFRLALKKPNSKELSEFFEQVRNWSLELEEQCFNASWELEKTEVNHRLLGRNRIPSALVFADSNAILECIGKRKVYEAYLQLYTTLTDPFPELEEWALQKPHQLLEQKDELERLIRILKWIKVHPRPGIYLRQLALDGVDTKFIERKRGILSVWLDRILEESAIDVKYSGVRHFAKRYGFLSKPELIRMLFPHVSDSPSGFSDLSVRSDEFCQRPIRIKRVIVIENDITALAFPTLQDSLILFGRGYDFSALEQADWLQERDLYYWGDLDTHGFAILSQFRGVFPQTRSLMMDRKTLLDHKDLWSAEEKPVKMLPNNLTPSEKSLFRDLAADKYGKNIRLEQELISYPHIVDSLESYFSM